ncbi:hypothetical protein KDA08_05905 [Candidatus Saccharibacteria bacterium]|nr:hypothetical protein [Candidatus Saccharibacteria bacterium]MCA9338158.1 hypothetical protein [Candidatus Saccharibacteria bacterium]
MQSGIEMFPSINLPPWWAIGGTIGFVVIIAGYFVVLYIMKLVARMIAKQLAEAKKPDVNKIINEALQKIESVRQDAKSGKVTMQYASGELSAITRGAFDSIMNHRTIYQTKDEVLRRQLRKVGGLLDDLYPAEFSKHNNLDDVDKLCDRSKEVLESCR